MTGLEFRLLKQVFKNLLGNACFMLKKYIALALPFFFLQKFTLILHVYKVNQNHFMGLSMKVQY